MLDKVRLGKVGLGQISRRGYVRLGNRSLSPSSKCMSG